MLIKILNLHNYYLSEYLCERLSEASTFQMHRQACYFAPGINIGTVIFYSFPIYKLYWRNQSMIRVLF